ncbi:hypothetical protein PENSPDRAFT_138238 [Peniophora sp. CONT]|nr:hypothetical protein PENSPDRAFT_138238 [Peniophora sp. CONT]
MPPVITSRTKQGKASWPPRRHLHVCVERPQNQSTPTIEDAVPIPRSIFIAMLHSPTPVRAVAPSNSVPFPSAPTLQRQNTAPIVLDVENLGYSYTDAYATLRVGRQERPISRNSRRSPAPSTWSYRYGSLSQKLSPVVEEGSDGRVPRRSHSFRARARSSAASTSRARHQSRARRPRPHSVAPSVLADDALLEEVTYAYFSMQPSAEREARKEEAMHHAKESKRRGPFRRVKSVAGATVRALATACNSIPPSTRRYWKHDRTWLNYFVLETRPDRRLSSALNSTNQGLALSSSSSPHLQSWSLSSLSSVL